jgi:hypothetical protein
MRCSEPCGGTKEEGMRKGRNRKERRKKRVENKRVKYVHP